METCRPTSTLSESLLELSLCSLRSSPHGQLRPQWEHSSPPQVCLPVSVHYIITALMDFLSKAWGSGLPSGFRFYLKGFPKHRCRWTTDKDTLFISFLVCGLPLNFSFSLTRWREGHTNTNICRHIFVMVILFVFSCFDIRVAQLWPKTITVTLWAQSLMTIIILNK